MMSRILRKEGIENSGNLSARSRKVGTQGPGAILKENKRPRLCISTPRSNDFFSAESLKNWDIERFGGTHHKFLECIWCETEFGKENAIWKHYPKR